jgi:hypothetical protein
VSFAPSQVRIALTKEDLNGERYTTPHREHGVGLEFNWRRLRWEEVKPKSLGPGIASSVIGPTSPGGGVGELAWTCPQTVKATPKFTHSRLPLTGGILLSASGQQAGTIKRLLRRTGESFAGGSHTRSGRHIWQISAGAWGMLHFLGKVSKPRPGAKALVVADFPQPDSSRYSVQNTLGSKKNQNASL